MSRVEITLILYGRVLVFVINEGLMISLSSISQLFFMDPDLVHDVLRTQFILKGNFFLFLE